MKAIAKKYLRRAYFKDRLHGFKCKVHHFVGTK